MIDSWSISLVPFISANGATHNPGTCNLAAPIWKASKCCPCSEPQLIPVFATCLGVASADTHWRCSRPRSDGEQLASRSKKQQLVMHSGAASCSTTELEYLLCCCCRSCFDLEDIQEKRFFTWEQNCCANITLQAKHSGTFSVSAVGHWVRLWKALFVSDLYFVFEFKFFVLQVHYSTEPVSSPLHFISIHASTICSV